MRGALLPSQRRFTPCTFVVGGGVFVFFLFSFSFFWGGGVPMKDRRREENALRPYIQTDVLSTRWRLKQEPELRGAHHLAVALIQLPLQSNASSHSHVACAFSPHR